jgi:hypothetical protein
MAHLWIADPLKPGVIRPAVATHPPIADRVKRLEEMGGAFLANASAQAADERSSAQAAEERSSDRSAGARSPRPPTSMLSEALPRRRAPA